MNLYKAVNDLSGTIAYLFNEYDNMINEEDLKNIYRNTLNL